MIAEKFYPKIAAVLPEHAKTSVGALVNYDNMELFKVLRAR